MTIADIILIAIFASLVFWLRWILLAMVFATLLFAFMVVAVPSMMFYDWLSSRRKK